jgi:hypothetical protein
MSSRVGLYLRMLLSLQISVRERRPSDIRCNPWYENPFCIGGSIGHSYETCVCWSYCVFIIFRVVDKIIMEPFIEIKSEFGVYVLFLLEGVRVNADV